jgi:hypothetical protein
MLPLIQAITMRISRRRQWVQSAIPEDCTPMAIQFWNPRREMGTLRQSHTCLDRHGFAWACARGSWSKLSRPFATSGAYLGSYSRQGAVTSTTKLERRRRRCRSPILFVMNTLSQIQASVAGRTAIHTAIERSKKYQTKAMPGTGLGQDPEILEGGVRFRTRVLGTGKDYCLLPRFLRVQGRSYYTLMRLCRR